MMTGAISVVRRQRSAIGTESLLWLPITGSLAPDAAFRRARRVGIERGIVAIERRAIRADDLGGVAHIEEHVRMVERRELPFAHELLRADLDHGHAGRVVEMGNDPVGHYPAFNSLATTVRLCGN